MGVTRSELLLIAAIVALWTIAMVVVVAHLTGAI